MTEYAVVEQEMRRGDVRDILGHEVRLATFADKMIFMDLWERFAHDIRGNGYELLWTPRTARFFSGLFDQYVRHELDGVVLMAGRVGTLCWGELAKEPPFDTTFGRTAYSLGSYVLPRYRRMGISARMRADAITRLRAMGFDSITGMARKENVAGYESALATGFVPHGTTGVLRLREE